jgi:putative endonuclease
MTDPHSLGQSGENQAASFLAKNGYRIACRNWRWGRNEIDIIAENEDFIVFVEVKTRANDFLTDLGTVIPRSKQQAIILAADGYIRKFRVDKNARFDLITITGTEVEQKIEHIEDVFYATLR